MVYFYLLVLSLYYWPLATASTLSPDPQIIFLASALNFYIPVLAPNLSSYFRFVRAITPQHIMFTLLHFLPKMWKQMYKRLVCWSVVLVKLASTSVWRSFSEIIHLF